RPVLGGNRPAAESHDEGTGAAGQALAICPASASKWYATRSVAASEAMQISANRGECACEYFNAARNDVQLRSLISPQPPDACICCSKWSTDRLPIPTTPNKSADTLIIENELGNGAPDIHVAHKRQCEVIEDEPLIIDPDGHDRMI